MNTRKQYMSHPEEIELMKIMSEPEIDDRAEKVLTCLQKMKLSTATPSPGVNIRDNEHLEDTPLCWAAYRGDIEIIKILIDANADVNLANGAYNDSPLSWAAFSRSVESVKLLIDSKANVNYENNRSEVFIDDLLLRSKYIWRGTETRETKIIRYALENGAIVNNPQILLEFLKKQSHENPDVFVSLNLLCTLCEEFKETISPKAEQYKKIMHEAYRYFESLEEPKESIELSKTTSEIIDDSIHEKAFPQDLIKLIHSYHNPYFAVFFKAKAEIPSENITSNNEKKLSNPGVI